jgi:hypothetical protein
MKVLITSGCSFSVTMNNNNKCWPGFLSETLELPLINKAMGSQGNGLITRSIIYEVTNQLKSYDAKDILVGAMFSGINRKDYYTENPDLLSFIINKSEDGVVENPTGFIENANKNWVILNQNWKAPPHKNDEAKYFYKYFYNDINAMIETLEHILRLQYFLKDKGIKYFFTCYLDTVLHNELINHNEVKHLYELLDLSNFLPVKSINNWIFENKVFLEDFEKTYYDNHPSNRQHKAFVDQVILPFINKL